jgi:hypothetical protein
MVDTERQDLKASMRDKRALVFYNELNSNWEKVLYIEECTYETNRNTGRWKTGIWRSRGDRKIMIRGCVPHSVMRKDGVTFSDAKELETGNMN